MITCTISKKKAYATRCGKSTTTDKRAKTMTNFHISIDRKLEHEQFFASRRENKNVPGNN